MARELGITLEKISPFDCFFDMDYEELNECPIEKEQLTKLKKKCFEKWTRMISEEKRPFYELARRENEKRLVDTLLYQLDQFKVAYLAHLEAGCTESAMLVLKQLRKLLRFSSRRAISNDNDERFSAAKKSSDGTDGQTSTSSPDQIKSEEHDDEKDQDYEAVFTRVIDQAKSMVGMYTG